MAAARKEKSDLFRGNYRYFVMVLGTMCLSAVFSNMISLNFTIVCMNPSRESRITSNNTLSRELVDAPEFDANGDRVHAYDQYEKTMLQWSVSVASMLATFPFSWLCSQYGARHTFLASGLLSTAATALLPAAADISFAAFIAARCLQGLSYACNFAVIGVVCTRWAPLHENGKFISVLTCFSTFSALITNFASGIICKSSWGWPWVHYAHAIVSLALFAAWALFYADEPHDCRFVGDRELEIIHHNKSDAHKFHEPYVPYMAIIKDKVVWAVWINAFMDLTCIMFLMIYTPTYLNKVLKIDVEMTGFFGALIFAPNAPMKILCGFCSDLFNCMSERHKLCFYNSMAVIVPALIYCALCFVPPQIPMITVALFAAIVATMGFNSGGFYKCGALVSRQYAEFVIACTQFIKCLVFFVAPAMVAIFVRDESEPGQWHAIFAIMTVSLIVAIIKDKVVWAVWINAFMDLTCVMFLVIYTPTYLNKVLKFDVEMTGFFGALIFAPNAPMKILFGFCSDLFNCMSERHKLCFYNSMAVIVPALIYCALCFVPPQIPMITVCLFAGIVGSLGFNSGGFYQCGALIARQYAEFVIACTQFIKCLVFFVAPAMVAIFVRDESEPGQWHAIFAIMTVSLIVANVIFCVFATDEPRSFTHITRRSASSAAAALSV